MRGAASPLTPTLSRREREFTLDLLKLVASTDHKTIVLYRRERIRGEG